MHRRRTAAGFAAVFVLTGALVFAGVTIAQADDGLEHDLPDTSTITWATAQAPVVFSGTATETMDVDVWVDGEFVVCSSTVSAGTWSCNSSNPLPAGAHDYIAVQTISPAPPVQVQDTVEIVVELPTPTVDGPAVVPPGGTISLTGGNAAEGATIVATVTTPNEPGLTCSTGVIVASGAWGCNIPFDAELPPSSVATVTVVQSVAGTPDTSTTHDVQILSGEFQVFSPSVDQVVTWDSAPNYFVVSGETSDPAPIDVYLDAEVVPFCTIPAPGNLWSCPGIQPAAGAHTLTATQGLNADQVVAFEVLLPEPGVSGMPFAFDENEPFVFGGQQLYPNAWTRVTIQYNAEGSPFDEAMPPVDCAPVAGFWDCSFPQSLPLGEYFATFEHFLVDDTDISADSVSYPLAIVVPASAPTLNCTFSPNGGFQVSSPQQMASFAVYEVIEDIGSSSGDSFGFQGYCNGSPGSPFPVDDGSLFFDLVANCSPSCAQSSLTPGVYEVYHTVSDGFEYPGVSYEPHSYVFTIPEAPAIGTASSTTNSVILSGSATPGDTVRIVRTNGATLCTTTATGGGAWTCAFPKSSASTARAIAIDPPSGGMSAYSAAQAIATAAQPAPVVPTLSLWFLQFGGNFTDLIPGQPFGVSVSGMPEGTEIEVWMHSTPQLIGTAIGTGAPMELEFTVPADLEPGEHMLEMIAVTPEGEVFTFTSDATVAAVKPSDGETKATPEEDAEESSAGGAASAGSGDRTDPAAPSGITDSIAPVAQILDNPVTIAIAGGLALALLFLVALPTELLNSSLSSNSSRLGRVYGTVDRAMTTAQDWLIRLTRSRAVAAGVLVVIVAIIYGFVDPDFGFDVVSLRLVLSLGIALFVLSFVASWISGMIIRRAWGAIGVVAMQPTIILFAVVGVVVARILEFSPGFLVGVAIGLELLQASKQVTARAVFVQIGVVTGLALAAWVVYSFFTPGDDFVGMLVDDTMVAITAEGLTGALIAVFPLKFLDGRELWEVSKPLWAAAFLLVAVAFALLVLPTAVQGTDVADYGVWLLVFAAFGLVSLAVWLIFVRADKRAAAQAEKVDA